MDNKKTSSDEAQNFQMFFRIFGPLSLITCLPLNGLDVMSTVFVLTSWVDFNQTLGEQRALLTAVFIGIFFQIVGAGSFAIWLVTRMNIRGYRGFGVVLPYVSAVAVVVGIFDSTTDAWEKTDDFNMLLLAAGEDKRPFLAALLIALACGLGSMLAGVICRRMKINIIYAAIVQLSVAFAVFLIAAPEIAGRISGGVLRGAPNTYGSFIAILVSYGVSILATLSTVFGLFFTRSMAATGKKKNANRPQPTASQRPTATARPRPVRMAAERRDHYTQQGGR